MENVRVIDSTYVMNEAILFHYINEEVVNNRDEQLKTYVSAYATDWQHEQ
jgi:hypothetical protein